MSQKIAVAGSGVPALEGVTENAEEDVAGVIICLGVRVSSFVKYVF